MKKQEIENMKAYDVLRRFESFRASSNNGRLKCYRYKLDDCNAEVIEHGKFIYLRSYMTVVACIDTKTHEFSDFLRYVYSYTSTSAKHISKFKTKFKDLIQHEYTYRPMKYSNISTKNKK